MRIAFYTRLVQMIRDVKIKYFLLFRCFCKYVRDFYLLLQLKSKSTFFVVNTQTNLYKYNSNNEHIILHLPNVNDRYKSLLKIYTPSLVIIIMYLACIVFVLFVYVLVSMCICVYLRVCGVRFSA